MSSANPQSIFPSYNRPLPQFHACVVDSNFMNLVRTTLALLYHRGRPATHIRRGNSLLFFPVQLQGWQGCFIALSTHNGRLSGGWGGVTAAQWPCQRPQPEIPTSRALHYELVHQLSALLALAANNRLPTRSTLVIRMASGCSEE